MDAFPDAFGDAIADALIDVFDAATDPIPDAMADSSVSGTRLRVKYYAGADGSKQFAGWHDSQLNQDCTFTLTSSGYRCLPALTYPNQIYFADAACTQVLHIASVAACGPYFGVAYATATCSGASYQSQSVEHVYQLSEVNPANVYSKAGLNCVSQTTPTAYKFFSQGNEIPLTDFEPATLEIE